MKQQESDFGKALREKIRNDLNKKSTSFIEAICQIENKEVPTFETDEELLAFYSEIQRRINDELLHSRQNPISANKLRSLVQLSEAGILPKSTDIILKSL